MRILVGVMHCIENEFADCIDAIRSQTLPAVDCFVLSNLPNKEAHDRLYSNFMARATEADLFIKVDADMVLCRNTFFEECASRFAENPDIVHMQIALDDWMTDRRIMGLHVFRSTHRWRIGNDEHVFVDMTDLNPDRVNDWNDLAPAASHCPNPSDFQSYHFGLHKAVKFMQLESSCINPSFRMAHWNHFLAMEAKYKRTKDRRIAMGVLGFSDALKHHWDSRNVDFNSISSKEKFSRWDSLLAEELFKAADRPGGLPSRMWPKWIRRKLIEFGLPNRRAGTVQRKKSDSQ